jgi:hypothetical protein
MRRDAGPPVPIEFRRKTSTAAGSGRALSCSEQMLVKPHVVERLLNHSMGAIGNQADSIGSAVAEVYILAKYMPPKMGDAIENSRTRSFKT